MRRGEIKEAVAFLKKSDAKKLLLIRSREFDAPLPRLTKFFGATFCSQKVAAYF
jgi:hypothetical protein